MRWWKRGNDALSVRTEPCAGKRFLTGSQRQRASWQMMLKFGIIFHLGTRGTSWRKLNRRPLAVERIRIVSNFRSLPDRFSNGTVLDHHFFDVDRGLSFRSFPDFIKCLSHDVVLINNVLCPMLVLSLIRSLLPHSTSKLVLVDPVLARPSATWGAWVINIIKRSLINNIDAFFSYQKDTRGYQEHYGIPTHKFYYIPFKINSYEKILTKKSQEGSYIFSGGRSYRDYATLCMQLPALTIRRSSCTRSGRSVGSTVPTSTRAPFPGMFGWSTTMGHPTRGSSTWRVPDLSFFRLVRMP